MSAAESRRPDRWPDAMSRLQQQIGLPDLPPAERGSALMPSAALLAAGALPVSCASHGGTMPEADMPGIWNRSTRPEAGL